MIGNDIDVEILGTQDVKALKSSHNNISSIDFSYIGRALCAWVGAKRYRQVGVATVLAVGVIFAGVETVQHFICGGPQLADSVKEKKSDRSEAAAREVEKWNMILSTERSPDFSGTRQDILNPVPNSWGVNHQRGPK
jgi:hypothetical protein